MKTTIQEVGSVADITVFYAPEVMEEEGVEFASALRIKLDGEESERNVIFVDDKFFDIQDESIKQFIITHECAHIKYNDVAIMADDIDESSLNAVVEQHEKMEFKADLFAATLVGADVAIRALSYIRDNASIDPKDRIFFVNGHIDRRIQNIKRSLYVTKEVTYEI